MEEHPRNEERRVETAQQIGNDHDQKEPATVQHRGGRIVHGQRKAVAQSLQKAEGEKIIQTEHQ